MVAIASTQGVLQHAPAVRCQSISSRIVSPVRPPAPVPCLFTQRQYVYDARVLVHRTQHRVPGNQVPTTTCAAAASEGAGVYLPEACLLCRTCISDA